MSSTNTETQSWVDSDAKEAAEMLARRSVFAGSLRTEKTAFLDRIGQAIADNPGISMTLAGAGIGAGVGGLSSFGRKKERRNTLGSALTGAAAGAGIGGGAYLLGKNFNGMPGGGSSDSKGLFQHNGKGYNLDPDAIKNNPGLIQQIDSLKEKSLPSKLISGATDTVTGLAKHNPLIATVMGLDAGVHGVGSAAHWLNPKVSLNPQHLATGLAKYVDDPKIFGDLSKPEAPHPIKALAKRFGAGELKTPRLQQILAEARQLGPGQAVPGLPGITTDHLKKLTDAGGGPVRVGGQRALADIWEGLPGKLKRTTDPLVGTGWDTAHAPGGGVGQLSGMGNKIRRLLGGGRENATLAKTVRGARMGKMLPRLGLYGAIPAVAAYARMRGQESTNSQKLEELLEQLSTPAGA